MLDNFFRYFYEDMGRIFQAIWELLLAVFNVFNYLLNFPMRMEIIKAHSDNFGTADWVLLLITHILLLALIIGLFVMLKRLMRHIFRFRVPAKKYDELKRQVQQLQRDLLRANYEKDKLLNLKIAGLGDMPQDVEEDSNEQEAEQTGLVPSNRNTFDAPPVDPSTSRFFRLTGVDNYYKTEYQPPEYDCDITLEELCERFRKYAASQLGLYYDLDLIRFFIAALGTSRILILQGISGTGKTSLAYAFGKFVQKDSTVVSVQPSWRERTELYGYYNEFTKTYNETDFLRAVYEANYYRDPHVVILDEMNIARVEYYFAELLSILEMPLESEWNIDIVTAMWDNDPCLIDSGKLHISNNLWFIGTINNDDSTFAVADKVYDRAVPIDLDSRAETFECEPTQPIYIHTDHINALFADAKQKYPISQDMLDKLDDMNAYLIKNFRLAFGNRVMKQIRDYVPCLIACGGTEIEAVDFIVAKKVLRKFESLSLGFMRDELTRFSTYLDKTFGKNKMPICKEYVERLKKTN